MLPKREQKSVTSVRHTHTSIKIYGLFSVETVIIILPAVFVMSMVMRVVLLCLTADYRICNVACDWVTIFNKVTEI
jgi:hypothetical protein